MNESTENDKVKKYLKAVGWACLPLAALCISCIVLMTVDFARFIIDAPTLRESDGIIYLIGKGFRAGCYIIYVATAVILTGLTVKFILDGIALIKQSNEKKTKSAITFSFVSSAAICLFSLYPFIISVCRIAVHGYLQQYYLEFWLSMVAFIFSVPCLVLNRITVKKYKSALNTNQ
ncbi:MAG: hypothetical protein K2L88_00740 [Clostridiales bacterium]|nr:hypothetical protein [Clostridiales bacterium]